MRDTQVFTLEEALLLRGSLEEVSVVLDEVILLVKGLGAFASSTRFSGDTMVLSSVLKAKGWLDRAVDEVKISFHDTPVGTFAGPERKVLEVFSDAEERMEELERLLKLIATRLKFIMMNYKTTSLFNSLAITQAYTYVTETIFLIPLDIEKWGKTIRAASLTSMPVSNGTIEMDTVKV